MAVFPDGTIEGAIERKYVSTLCQMGLSNEDANDAILRFAQHSEGQDARPRAGNVLLEFAETDAKARAAIDALCDSPGLSDTGGGRIMAPQGGSKDERIQVRGVVQAAAIF